VTRETIGRRRRDRPGAEQTDDDQRRYLPDLVAASNPRTRRAGQVEMPLDGGHHHAEKTVGETLHTVREADEYDEADDVVQPLKPPWTTAAAAVTLVHVLAGCFRGISQR